MVAYTRGAKLREWPPLLPSPGWSVAADEAFCEHGQHAGPPPVPQGPQQGNAFSLPQVPSTPLQPGGFPNTEEPQTQT